MSGINKEKFFSYIGTAVFCVSLFFLGGCSLPEDMQDRLDNLLPEKKQDKGGGDPAKIGIKGGSSGAGVGDAYDKEVVRKTINRRNCIADECLGVEGLNYPATKLPDDIQTFVIPITWKEFNSFLVVCLE